MNFRGSIPLIVVLLFLMAEPLLNPFSRQILPASLILAALAIALVCGCCFFWFCIKRKEQSEFWNSILEPQPITRRDWFVLLLIVSLAAFLRLWRLDSLFVGMAWDEAYKGLDAIAIREHHERPIYLNWNAQRDAMVAYLVAFAQMLMGTGIDSVRIVMAVAGTLSVGLYFLLLRRLFHPSVGFIAAFCLAVSKWHVIHSRYAVRIPLLPFFELLILLLAVLGLQSKRRVSVCLLLAGIATGLGFYTYIAYRVFPLVLLLFVFQEPLRGLLKRHWKTLAAALVLAGMITFPLARFLLQNRESLTSRMSRTAVWKQSGTDEAAHSLILESTLKTLGMFTYSGDPIARHNVDGEPMLSRFLSSFFLLGLLCCMANIRKPFALFFLAYFSLSVLPGCLSVHAPQSSRTLATVIPAYFFIATGVITTLRIVGEHSLQLKNWLAGIVLAGALLTNVFDAMVRYPQNLDSLSSYESALYGMDRDQTEVANLMNQLGQNETIFATPQLYFHSTVEYLTHGKTRHQVFYSRVDLDRNTYPGDIAIVFLQPNHLNLWWLRDAPDKDFFKWWRQDEGRSMDETGHILQDSYWSHAHRMWMSDQGLLKLLKSRHPGGKEVRFEHFSIFLYRP